VLGVAQTEEEFPHRASTAPGSSGKGRAIKARLKTGQSETDRERVVCTSDEQRPRNGTGRLFKRPFGAPDGKVQDNVTDPQSRIMKKVGRVEQPYTMQAAVGGESHGAIAYGLDNNAADDGESLSLLKAANFRDNCLLGCCRFDLI
jgi:hypothetical protein